MPSSFINMYSFLCNNVNGTFSYLWLIPSSTQHISGVKSINKDPIESCSQPSSYRSHQGQSLSSPLPNTLLIHIILQSNGYIILLTQQSCIYNTLFILKFYNQSVILIILVGFFINLIYTNLCTLQDCCFYRRQQWLQFHLMSQNIQKINLFASMSLQPMPKLQRSTSIVQIIRSYFKGDFIIQSDMGTYFDDHIQTIYDNWLQKQPKTKNSFLLIDFMHYWSKEDPSVSISYNTFDQIVVQQAKRYCNGIVKKYAKNDPIVAKVSHPSNNIANTQQDVKEYKSSKSIRHYLKAYYNHYVLKAGGLSHFTDFENINEHYSKLSLNKWAIFCRDMHILNKTKKISNKYLSNIFQTKSTKGYLNFNEFVEAVLTVLNRIYPNNQSEGLQFLGIKDKKNHHAKLSALGIYVPKNKVVFHNHSQLPIIQKNHSRRNESTPKQPNAVTKQQASILNIKSSSISSKIFPTVNPIKNPNVLTKQQRVKLNRELSDRLQKMIGECDDPYLQQYNQSLVQNGQGIGVMTRIQNRINLMMNPLK